MATYPFEALKIITWILLLIFPGIKSKVFTQFYYVFFRFKAVIKKNAKIFENSYLSVLNISYRCKVFCNDTFKNLFTLKIIYALDKDGGNKNQYSTQNKVCIYSFKFNSLIIILNFYF